MLLNIPVCDKTLHGTRDTPPLMANVIIFFHILIDMIVEIHTYVQGVFFDLFLKVASACWS